MAIPTFTAESAGSAKGISAEPKPTRIPINAFLKTRDIGPKVAKEGLLTREGRKQEGETPEYAELSHSLREHYRRELNNYVTALLKLKNPRDPTNDLFSKVLSNTIHAWEKDLVESLSSEVRNEATGELIGYKVNERAVERYLDKEDGWINTTMLLERRIALTMAALGGYMEAIPPGDRQTLPQPGRYRTGLEAGFFRDVYEDFWKRLPGTTAQKIRFARASGVTGAVGFVLGGGLGGGLAGAGLPSAALGAFRTAQYLSREGLVLDLKQSAGVFRAINNDPNEKSYVKAVFGIDTDDFEIVAPAAVGGAETIELKAGRTPRTQGHAKELVREILQGVYARQEFYTSLGIPLSNLDSIPEQFILSVVDFKPEQTRADWQDEVLEEFKPDGDPVTVQGGIRDTLGRIKGIDPNFGIGAELDYEGNARRYWEARARVLESRIGTYNWKETKAGETTNAVEIMKKRMVELGTPEGKKKRVAEDVKKKEALGSDKTAVLEVEKTFVDTYKTNLAELQKAGDELNTQLISIAIPGVAGIPDLTRAIQGLNDLIQSGTSINVGGRLIRSFTDTEDVLLTRKDGELAAIPAGLRDAEYQNRVRRIENRLQPDFARLEDDKRFIEQLKTRLTELDAKVKEKQAALGEKSDAAAKIKPIDSAEDFLSLTTWGITEADLRTQTVQQLLAQINAANVANPAIGWEESKNGKQDSRLKVYRAMTEARARQTEPLVAVPGAEFTTLTGATWQISENQLRTLTPDEVNNLITARIAALNAAGLAVPASPTPDQIRRAMKVASDRFVGRAAGLLELVTFTDKQIQELDDTISNANFEREITLLGVTVDLLQRYGEVRSLGLTITSKQAEFLNATAVTAADKEFTPAETTLGQPRGCYEFMDLLFRYRGNPARSEYFGKIIRLLPPDRLAQFLYNSLDLAPIGPPPPGGFLAPTMASVLPEINLRIASGDISSKEFSDAIRDMSLRLRDEGMAIAA